jgi:hypothetical protein
MLNITRGQKPIGDTSHARSRAPRRSVVFGSLGLLVAGIVLSATALPVMADAVTNSTSLTTHSKTASSLQTTPRSTHTESAKVLAHRRARAHVAALRHAARLARIAATTRTTLPAVQIASTSVTTTTLPTTTLPVTTTTLSPTPTTTVPVTTTTIAKSPPVAKVPSSIPNPNANIAPSPNFLVTGHCTFANGVWGCDNPCVAGSATALSWPGFTNGVACADYVLQAINHARAVEGIHPMVLPNNWFSLTTPEQLFVVADLERTARGLPAYVGLNSALNADAQHAAATNNDPTVAAGFPMGNDAQGSAGFGGAWSGGFNVLAADYVWMYDDAWAGSAAATSNVACTSAHAAGCWAHRDELLGSDPGFNPGVGLGCTTCEMGTGFAMVNGHGSYVDLIELPKGALPPMTYTWANNVLPNLN